MPPKNTGMQSKRALQQLAQRFVGVSASTLHVRELVARVSTTDATVLIQGESGTGKEVVAKLVHDLSSRSSDQKDLNSLKLQTLSQVLKNLHIVKCFQTHPNASKSMQMAPNGSQQVRTGPRT